MSLVTRYRLFWAALTAALLGLAFWKNSRSYPHKSRLWRLGKAVIDTGLVALMVIYAPALLLMYVVVWVPCYTHTLKPQNHAPWQPVRGAEEQ
jgi:small-conductance mechanosensitive channel